MPTKEKIANFGVIESRFCDTVGDGTGSINANVNGSVTPVEFMVTAPANTWIALNRLVVFVKDGGSFDTGSYGNGITMTTGIKIILRDADLTEEDVTVQKSIKFNTDWSAYCYDVMHHNFGSGDETLTARYTFTKDGSPIILPPGRSFVVQINDDLTGLDEHTFRLGLVEYKPSISG